MDILTQKKARHGLPTVLGKIANVVLMLAIVPINLLFAVRRTAEAWILVSLVFVVVVSATSYRNTLEINLQEKSLTLEWAILWQRVIRREKYSFKDVLDVSFGHEASFGSGMVTIRLSDGKKLVFEPGLNLIRCREYVDLLRNCILGMGYGRVPVSKDGVQEE